MSWAAQIHCRLAYTVQDKMCDNSKFSSGFDYMRLALALLVIVSHALILPYSREVGDAFVKSVYYRPFVIILPMFFFLSGFLVTGSYRRTENLVEFYGLRIIRIVPALVCEVTLMAIVIGPLITVLPIGLYLSDQLFHSYFLNIVGEIHVLLPGVFNNNPYTNFTNAQLWTIPYELLCYIVLGVVAIVGGVRHRWVALVALSFLYVIVGFLMVTGSRYYDIRGENLVVAFLAGVTAFLYAEKIPFDRWVAVGCGVLVVGMIFVKGGTYLALVPIGYVTLYLGLMNPRRIGPVRTGDYSYGLYLFGYPIQQLITSWGEWTHSWYVNLALSLPLACFAALLSWHLVERPFQRLKTVVKRLGNIHPRNWRAKMETPRP